MTVKSILYSALILIGIILLIEIGISFKEKLEDTKFKVFQSQVEESK